MWLIDTPDDYAVIQNVEKQQNVNLTKIVLLGFVTAPYINESLLYAKWQRQLKRKIAIMLERSDLLEPYDAAKSEIKPWKYVVLLAASMGGPLAIKEFLDNLPEDLPVALLLAQHFNQNTLNTLPRILNRHNEWRCDIVTNTQQLLTGRCLILPIEHSVVCDSNGRVILQRKPWQGSYKPPISDVMRNCSEAFGNNLITIVFSGMGNDGSDAAATVKKNGSIIWAQSPDSSTCASQPQSMIESNQVTFVGTPKQLAEQLIALCG